MSSLQWGAFIKEFYLLIEYSPYLLMVLSLVILYGLYRIYKATDSWRFLALMFIPASLFILYFWIAFFNPDMQSSKSAFRIVMIFDMANAIHVIYTYLAERLKERGRV